MAASSRRHFCSSFRIQNLWLKLSQIPSDAIVMLSDGICRQRRQDLCSCAGCGRIVRAVASAGLWTLRYLYRQGHPSAALSRHSNRSASARQTWRIEIMAGKDPATIAPRTNPAQHYRVDYRAMARWKLSEKNLPPDTGSCSRSRRSGIEYRGTVLAAHLHGRLANDDCWRPCCFSGAEGCASKICSRKAKSG